MTLHDGEQSSQEWRSEQAASGGLQSRAPRGTRIAALFVVSLSSLLSRSSRPAVSPPARRSLITPFSNDAFHFFKDKINDNCSQSIVQLSFF